MELELGGTCAGPHTFVLRDPTSGVLLAAGGTVTKASVDGWQVTLDPEDSRCAPMACVDTTCRSVPVVFRRGDDQVRLYSQEVGRVGPYALSVFEAGVTEEPDGSAHAVARWAIVLDPT